MINLIKELSEADNKRIENFIDLYGVRREYYRGNESYLLDWSKNKQKMYKLLGNKLIYSFDFSCKKDISYLEKECGTLVEKYRTFLDEVTDIIRDKVTTSGDNLLSRIPKNRVIDLFYRQDQYATNSIKREFEIGREKDKKILKITEGMKTLKAVGKVLAFFDLDKTYAKEFEEFRNAHSMILNEKNISGNICLSIHPLDFMTMSDNDNDWSSCMSWVSEGCYHLGTVEMMNSNNVIVAYISSKNSVYNFNNGLLNCDEEYLTWNNKKWRQLFYCTPEILMNGKSYPYANANISQTVLNKLRDLAKENLNWEYKYGIEEYHDSNGIYTQYHIDRQREFLQFGDDRHNIIFTTNTMYNDMLNDGYTKYYCYRNPVARKKIISVSGKAKCLCCNCISDKLTYKKELDDGYDEDYSRHSEGSFNNLYTNTKQLVCRDCRKKITKTLCAECQRDIGIKNNVVYFNGKVYCLACAKDILKICPDCNNIFNCEGYILRENCLIINEKNKTIDTSKDGFRIILWNTYRERERVTINRNGYSEHNLIYCACPSCCKKAIAKYGITEVCKPSYNWYASPIAPTISVHITKKEYDKDDTFVALHTKKNLKTPSMKNLIEKQ